MEPFQRWGTSHLTVLAMTVIGPLVLALAARRERSGRAARAIEIALGCILFAGTVARGWWLNASVVTRWQDMMPMHLCDWALFATALACLTRRQVAFEMAYFWGLAGTLQGLLTPDLSMDFPALRFVFFFLVHGGIVGTVLYLMAGSGMRPQWSSVGRAYFGLFLYAVIAGTYDWLTATNYGYFRAKPGAGSIMDMFGPWPWYIGALAVFAAVNFTVLYLPWALADRWRSRSAAH